MTHSHVRRALLKCATCLVQMCDMTHHVTHWQVALSDTGMLQCVAVCCSVLQYVAGCDMTHHMTHWQVTVSDTGVL